MKRSLFLLLPLLFSLSVPSLAANYGRHHHSRHSARSGSSSASSRSSSVSSSSSSQSSVPATPSTGRSWGAYVGESAADADAFESLVQKKMNIQAVFVSSGDSFPSELGNKGRTLLIFWEPTVNLDAINAGKLDSGLKQFAADAKASGTPVLFAPFHEMNGNWDVWDGTVGSNTPAKLITAWKHVHDLFAGVPNVKFMWAVNSDSVPNSLANGIDSYYPGSSYVDIVAEDAFNFGGQTFTQVAGAALNQLKTYNKPIYLSSIGACPGSDKPQWITDAMKAAVQGIIYFNQNGPECNFKVDSDPASLQAFKSGLSSL